MGKLLCSLLLLPSHYCSDKTWVGHCVLCPPIIDAPACNMTHTLCMYWIQPTCRVTPFVSFILYLLPKGFRKWLSFWNCYGISYHFEIQHYYVTTSSILDITICNQLDFDYELLHTDHIIWRTCKIFPCNQKFFGEIIDIIKDLKEHRENVEVYKFKFGPIV